MKEELKALTEELWGVAHRDANYNASDSTHTAIWGYVTYCIIDPIWHSIDIPVKEGIWYSIEEGLKDE